MVCHVFCTGKQTESGPHHQCGEASKSRQALDMQGRRGVKHVAGNECLGLVQHCLCSPGQLVVAFILGDIEDVRRCEEMHLYHLDALMNKAVSTVPAQRNGVVPVLLVSSYGQAEIYRARYHLL